jgi:hypothetical protein
MMSGWTVGVFSFIAVYLTSHRASVEWTSSTVKAGIPFSFVSLSIGAGFFGIGSLNQHAVSHAYAGG